MIDWQKRKAVWCWVIAAQNTCQICFLHLTHRSELFLPMLILIYVNDIQSDSTFLTLGAELLVKAHLSPPVISPHRSLQMTTLWFLACIQPYGLIEERNKSDNIYWTLNQSVSVNLADTMPQLHGAHGLHCRRLPYICSDNHLACACSLYCPTTGDNTNTVVVLESWVCWVLRTCTLIHCSI